MKQAERHLASRVFEINRTAAHERPLRGTYSYEQILGVDLAEECLAVLERKGAPVRVLDIGCGSGLALHQLEETLAARGLEGRFELMGMGLNWYKRMYISPTRFLMSGLYHSSYHGPGFDLVFSVFAFHYLWHKLEGLERIHNQLLAPGGLALLHFPAYLLRLPGAGEEEEGDEVAADAAFQRFLDAFHREHDSPRFAYVPIPLHSDDDDGVLLNELGRLSFRREEARRLDFGLELSGFGVLPSGFRYKHPNVSRPDYVVSRYERRATRPAPAAPELGLEPHRLHRARVRLPDPAGAGDDLELVVHPLLSPLLVVAVPGAREDLDRGNLPFEQMAANVQEAGLAAIVRCNHPPISERKLTAVLRAHLQRLMEYVRTHLEEICGTPRARVALMGYSSGAGAVAAFAAEHPLVDQILLLAPSLDVGREAIEAGLAAFEGAVYVVSGDSDRVVPPEQARWFYETARRARRRRLVEVVCCDHEFSGEFNQALARHAPLWAFGDSQEFPPPDLSEG